MNVTYDGATAVNGQIVATAEARISPFGEGVMFGRGLFETIKVLDGRMVFFAAHHARLASSCEALGLTWSADLRALRERCQAVITANARVNGALKIMVLEDTAKCAEIVVTRAPVYSEKNYLHGFHLDVQPDRVARRSPAHKSTNYLANLTARQAARDRGADDALFVSDAGEVIEGAATNIFVVVGGKVLTPPLARGVLPGIVRGEILKRWKDRGAEERPIMRGMLDAAEEIFVTNALLGVMPVSRIDGRLYSISTYKVVPALRTALVQWQREEP